MIKKNRHSSNYRTRKVLGVRVDALSLMEILNRVEKLVKYNKKDQITTPNPEHIVIAQKDYRMRSIINNSWLAVPDGVGLVWAARLQFRQFHRLSGVDLMLELCKLAAVKNWRVFLLGGGVGVAQKAAQVLNNITMKQCSNELKVAYDQGPANVKNESLIQNRRTIKKINNFEPEFLFVAFGAPMQEKWIADNLKKLNVNLAMGVGGAFDYISGRLKRAPKWIRKLNLEWWWRLIHQPWRGKRQLRLVKFIFLISKEWLLGS